MAESLRDQLSANFDTVVAEQEQAPQPEAPAVETAEAPPAEAAPSQPEKPGRTAGRARDEHGRLLPGPAKKPDAPAPEVLAAPAKPRPPRPSSWKKDYWDHWEKLDPNLAEYLNQRESEFAKGVSTYKAEFDQVKPLQEAMQEFMPLLQQNRIEPVQWIRNLGNAHRQLATGSPDQKLGMFIKLAQDYQVPIQQMFVRGQDGQVYFNQQLMQQAQPAPQQQAQQPDMRKTVREILDEERAVQEAAAMEADTQKYPHFATVKAEMAGLLQSGLAKDLPSAYDAALRLPQHFHLFEAGQKQAREAEEKKKREEAAAAAIRARSNAVSPKTATPTAAVGSNGKKGLREQLSENFDAHVGGRV